MRQWRRAARLMLSIGWEIGPVVFLGWVAISVAESLGPFLFALGLRPLVNGIYTGRDGHAVLGGVVCAGALLMLVATPPVGRWVFPRVIERSIMAVRSRLLRMAATAPGLDHFERPDFWDRLQLLQRGFGDLLQSAATVFVGPLVLLQLLVTAAVLAGVQPWLLVLPAVALPAAWLTKRAETLRRAGEEQTAESRRAAEHLFALAASSQAGKEIRIYRLEQELLRRHRDLCRGIQRTTESALFRSASLAGTGWLLFAIAYLAAALVSLHAAAAGHLSPGDVALTLTLAAALVAASGQLTDLAGLLSRAVTVAGHYHWLADQIPTPDAPHPRGATTPKPVIPHRLTDGLDLRDISFAYPGGDHPALRDVTLRLDAGTVVALVGENGAGKTTLVKLLTRMYAPTRGQILLDGVDLGQFDIATYRRRLAAGFQDFARFELLLRETVGIGDLTRLTDTPAVRQTLTKAKAEFAHELPTGIDTQLGQSWEGGVDLSGGEWQKLALARAMMRDDPLLVIYDEPTAALDPQTEHALFEQIATDMRHGSSDGRITLLVSHRFSTVRMADLIVVLDHGRVVEVGSHGALTIAGGLYAELYGLQSRAYR